MALRAGGACMIIDDFGRHALLGYTWLGHKQYNSSIVWSRWGVAIPCIIAQICACTHSYEYSYLIIFGKG